MDGLSGDLEYHYPAHPGKDSSPCDPEDGRFGNFPSSRAFPWFYHLSICGRKSAYLNSHGIGNDAR